MIDLVQLGARPKASSILAPFRFREIGGEVLLTNLLGDWVFVSKDELAALYKDEVREGSPLYDRLASRNFVRAKLDVAKQAERFLREGALRTHPLVVAVCEELGGEIGRIKLDGDPD